MANQEISLKWNGYQNNILTNVKELFQDEGLSDVTLVSEGQSFKAHKVILSANSLIFKSIFQQNPHKDPIIVLHDINTASLRTLLTFMYNGEVNVTEEFLPVLLKTAEILRICGLSAGTDSSVRGIEKKQPDKVTQPVESQILRKRKKSEVEDESGKNKKIPSNEEVKKKTTNQPPKAETPNAVPDNIVTNIIPKLEPDDSPLTDYSLENTNDTDTSLADTEKKCTNICSSYKSIKNWISEVGSTEPNINLGEKSPKKDGNDDEKDSSEIDKEVENVLQSGTIVESLNIATDNINTEITACKDKNQICYANPSFPCPFCPRVYNSWGYRRRHVKSRHMTNKLSCKWCVSVLPSTGAWYSHATKAHGVPHDEARNCLVVMVEAHAVLTLHEPTANQLLGQVGLPDNNSQIDSDT